jgi:hypothetical protein
MFRGKMMPALVAGCGVAVVGALTSGAAGAPIYSGEANQAISSNLSIDFVTGDTGSSSDLPGWDVTINFSNSAAWEFSWNDNGIIENSAAAGNTNDQVGLLNFGEAIDATGNFTNGGLDQAPEFNPVEEGFFGFQIYNEASDGMHFGWGRVTLSENGNGTLIDYAYESEAGFGITAGAGIPEPGSLGLIAAAGLFLRRRRA